MDFEEAVEKAPPGWRHFRVEDIDRLPSAVRAHELARVPRDETEERILRGLFWTFVYHLEPDRWDELARHEPIAAGLLDALPQQVLIAVDVGAGSGRLTEHLATRTRRTIAVEPSAGLRALLTQRLPTVRVLAGWAERLPLRDRSSQLTAACGAFGPDPEILAELERVTVPGGTIALVSPEQPDWFAERGWERISVSAQRPPPHPAWLDEFFGPLDPPHEMVMRRLEAG
jgi:SAM-dependent methyltransferase